MKWFAIGLLVANVAVFGWRFNEHIRTEAVAVAGRPTLPPGTPTLTLISELPELPPPREHTGASPAPSLDAESTVVQAVDLSTEINSDAIASNVCVEIGPITDQQTVAAVKDWLSERTTVIHTRAETVRERRFFWVYLEPASDEEARRKLDDLAQRGVTDYMLIRRGGLKNAISLGLFRSQDSVNRRLAEMTEQGYKPVVVPKFESTENFWIRATMEQGHEDTSELGPELLDSAQLTTKQCRDEPAAEPEPSA